MDRFSAFGAALASFGVPFSLFSYFLLSNVPMTALGIGITILGLSILMTPTEPVPKGAVRAILEGSVLAIEALLEEADASSPGYYVACDDGRVYALVPLARDAGPPPTTPPKGLVTSVGGEPYLALPPPASELINYVNLPGDLDSAIGEILVDITELCESVKVARGDVVAVEIKGPRSSVGAARFRRVLGSLEASVAASTAAAVLRLPVRVSSEVDEGRVKRVALEVIGK